MPNHAIAIHPYYKMEREITKNGQDTIAHQRVMTLFETEITTGYRAFPIQEVYDISYRRMGEEEGLLYLHTRQGVFSYNVKSDPNSFIQAYKDLTKKL